MGSRLTVIIRNPHCLYTTRNGEEKKKDKFDTLVHASLITFSITSELLKKGNLHLLKVSERLQGLR